MTGSQDLRGRKAADAAFWFAVAGVKDTNDYELFPQSIDTGDTKMDLSFSIFDALVFVCLQELRRFGKRKSCRSLDILHIMERMAAAGANGDLFKTLQLVAVECLQVKMRERDAVALELEQNGVVNSMRKGIFGLHSHRTLLWVWRFSTRQRKQRIFLESAAKHWDNGLGKNENSSGDVTKGPREQQEPFLRWEDIYDDTTRPLVIDVGCGMGISLLGLATLQDEGQSLEGSVLDLDWTECNFLGADLSRLAIGFGTSISHRWNLKGKLHYEITSAQELLENVQTYPGDVKLIMIQFPTPFRLQLGGEFGGEKLKSVVNQGNQQLPTNAYDGFMVTVDLLKVAHHLLKEAAGKLLLQSNCEDVAVLMRNMAVQDVGFQVSQVPFGVKWGGEDQQLRIPRRTEEWINLGGERAEGDEWSSEPLIPFKGATETEVSCILNGTPIHRCILNPS